MGKRGIERVTWVRWQVLSTPIQSLLLYITATHQVVSTVLVVDERKEEEAMATTEANDEEK
jgi:hypothetical protein